MSKEALLDIIEINKLVKATEEEDDQKRNEFKIKPAREAFREKFRKSPNKFLHKYLGKARKALSPQHYKIQNWGHWGRRGIHEYVWACIHYRYDDVESLWASFSPQLYILVHTGGIKFGFDYGNHVDENSPIVQSVRNDSSLQKEALEMMAKFKPYELSSGAAKLAKISDKLTIESANDVRSNWSNRIHLIQQYRTDRFGELDEAQIEEELFSLVRFFKNVCESRFEIGTEEDSQSNQYDEEEEAKSDVEESGNVLEYSKKNLLEETFLIEEEAQDLLHLLSFKKNIVLSGPPGTGKTYIAERLAYAHLGGRRSENVEKVQFHQSYSYEDFIEGFRPDGNGGFTKVKGSFLKMVERAKQSPASKFYFIIDEINRGNLSKIFGELLMLIEHDKRGESHGLKLTYTPEKDFYIPENVHLIGTMNTADRSIAMVDFAIRRRFSFYNLQPKFGGKFQSFLYQHSISDTVIRSIVKKIGRLNEVISNDMNLGPGYCIGHSHFCNFKNSSKDWDKWFSMIVRYEIEPLLKEYWFEDPDKADSEIEKLSE